MADKPVKQQLDEAKETASQAGLMKYRKDIKSLLTADETTRGKRQDIYGPSKQD